MEKSLTIFEVYGTEKLALEETIDFTCSPNLPYTMLRILGDSTNGIVCLGIEGSVLWIGRIYGTNIATYFVWRTIKALAKLRGCTKILAGNSREGLPFFKAGRFQQNEDTDWERVI